MSLRAAGAAGKERFGAGRSNNLDLVRFVAATLVLVSHSYTLTARGGEPALFAYETLGGLAVAIFFVISGFLVTAAWQRTPALGAFARNRALRIMPALIVVVSLSALVLGPLLTPLRLGEYFMHPQTRDYFVNLTFVQLNYSLPAVFATNPYPHVVNGSLWTLPIEVAMYVAVAALAMSGALRRLPIALLVALLALLSVAAGPAVLQRAAPYLLDTLPPAPMAQLGLWFFTGSAFWLWRHHIPYYSTVALLLLAGEWWLQGTGAGRVLLQIALPYVVLWFAQLDLPQVARFGRHGDFSYGMYLYAFPVQQTFAHFGAGSWPLPAYIGGCFAVTLLCAMASWRWVEAPALRLKRRSRKVSPPMLDPANRTEREPSASAP